MCFKLVSMLKNSVKKSKNLFCLLQEKIPSHYFAGSRRKRENLSGSSFKRKSVPEEAVVSKKTLKITNEEDNVSTQPKDSSLPSACTCKVAHHLKVVDLMLTLWSLARNDFHGDAYANCISKAAIRIVENLSTIISLEEFEKNYENVIEKMNTLRHLKNRYILQNELIYNRCGQSPEHDEEKAKFDQNKREIISHCYQNEIVLLRRGQPRGPGIHTNERNRPMDKLGKDENGILTWKVPVTGVYKISAHGACNTIKTQWYAKNGTQKKLIDMGVLENPLHNTYGIPDTYGKIQYGIPDGNDDWPQVLARGAIVTANFELNRGETIQILIGTPGTHISDGCGGTFVYNADRKELLLVAGGAGGITKYESCIERFASGSLQCYGNTSDNESGCREQELGGGGCTIDCTAGGGGGIIKAPLNVTNESFINEATSFFPTSRMMVGGHMKKNISKKVTYQGGGLGGGGYSYRCWTQIGRSKQKHLTVLGCGGGGGYSGGHAGKTYGGGGGSFSQDPNAIFTLVPGQPENGVEDMKNFFGRCIIHLPDGRRSSKSKVGFKQGILH